MVGAVLELAMYLSLVRTFICLNIKIHVRAIHNSDIIVVSRFFYSPTV
jgi:hypothetical protein